VSKPSRIRASWYFVPLLLFFLVALIAIGVLYQGPHSAEEAVSSESATSPVSRVAYGTEVKAWANRAVIRSGDSFEIWVLVKNLGSLPLTHLQIVGLDSRGFVPVGNCWVEGVPGCRPGVPSSEQPAGLEATLQAGVTGMVYADLKRSGGLPKPIVAHLAWNLGGRSQEQSVEVRMDMAPRAPHWAVVLYSVLKDFLLPVLLGILAYLFQHVLQDRSRMQAARNVLLPTATTSAVQYLMPIVGAAGGLRAASDAEQGFFYFVFLLKRMRDLSGKGGGFFLGDLQSEELITECWNVFRRQVIEYFGYLDLSHAMDLMEKRETISKFLGHLQSPKGPLTSAQSAAQRVKGGFSAWRLSGDPTLKLLEVMSRVIQIETNRLYLGWYERVENPTAEELKGWEEAILAFRQAHPQVAENLGEKLEQYVSTLPRNIRRHFQKQRAPRSAAPVVPS
jgi:hypothetical protein